MSDLPLYDSLVALAKRGTARFHMPGHKGRKRGCALDGAFEIDYTEIPETGNLYTTDGAIHESENLAADFYGAEGCVFLTCGATQGVKAALAEFCGADAPVLLDRNCHKSAIDACVLLNLTPSYVCPQVLDKYAVTGDISTQEIDLSLSENQEIRAVLVTSPTYYGVNLNLTQICEVVHSHGAALIVDSAHGSHLRACNIPDALDAGADAVIFSAHKTLNAMTQGAYLLARDKSRLESLREKASLVGTSSPSYPIMASLDLAQKWLRTDEWARCAEACQSLREKVERETCFELPNFGDLCRLSIFAPSHGKELAEHLRQCDVEPEMSDVDFVVCIATPADLNGNLDALEHALLSAEIKLTCEQKSCALPTLERAALTPRKAVFSRTQSASLIECAGRISAENIAIFPPGVAIIVAGEIIQKNKIEYLSQMDYNIDTTIKVVAEMHSQ